MGPVPQEQEAAVTENSIGVCPVYRECGGCQLQNVPYEEQLRRKQEREEQLLGRFQKVEQIIGMQDPTHYRNKVTAAFGEDRNKHIVSGIYQPNSHRIVPVDSCMIEDRISERERLAASCYDPQRVSDRRTDGGACCCISNL